MTRQIAKFTEAESDAAYETWGCNCGPGALAAIMGMSLDRKRYMSPTMMDRALNSIGRPWRKVGDDWPEFGLVRIQWEGPWTKPGVPIKARYWYTHWIASYFTIERGHGVFDINTCRFNGTGWSTREQWEKGVAPLIIKSIPRASSTWHVTHGIEIE